MIKPGSDVRGRPVVRPPRLVPTWGVVVALSTWVGAGLLAGALATAAVAPGGGGPVPVLGLSLSLLGVWTAVLALLSVLARRPVRAAGRCAGFFLGLAVAWAIWVDGPAGTDLVPGPGWRAVAAVTAVPALAALVAWARDVRRRAALRPGLVLAVPVAVLAGEALWLLRSGHEDAGPVAAVDLVLAALLVLLPRRAGGRVVQVAAAGTAAAGFALLLEVAPGLLPPPG